MVAEREFLLVGEARKLGERTTPDAAEMFLRRLAVDNGYDWKVMAWRASDRNIWVARVDGMSETAILDLQRSVVKKGAERRIGRRTDFIFAPRAWYAKQYGIDAFPLRKSHILQPSYYGWETMKVGGPHIMANTAWSFLRGSLVNAMMFRELDWEFLIKRCPELEVLEAKRKMIRPWWQVHRVK